MPRPRRQYEDGTPFIAMEYLKGDDLSAVLRRKKRIPIPEAVDYLLQACEALGEAHANDIVHRDLKPGNLVIVTRKDGTRCLKVIDFGISKVATETSSDLTNTLAISARRRTRRPSSSRRRVR